MASLGNLLGWRRAAAPAPVPREQSYKIPASELLVQASQHLYRERLIGRGVGIAYDDPAGTEPCLLAVGILMPVPLGIPEPEKFVPWGHVSKDGRDYVELQFANGVSINRNRRSPAVGAELFLPNAVICTRRREFKILADRIAELIMDSDMGVGMEDYYAVLERANSEVPE